MFIFPKLVEERKSKFNGKIQVYQLFGKYSLNVDNLTQSGGLMYPIWRKALKETKRYSLNPSRCLILGLGGGNAAEIISKIWPEATITGIEIDPAMIALGKKYLNLNKVPNLVIINGDAFKVLRNQKSVIRNQHALILVDTYQGKHFPSQAKSTKFFVQLKKLLAPKGIVIFNRLNYDHNDKDIKAHIDKISQVFTKVTQRKILSNVIISASDT